MAPTKYVPLLLACCSALLIQIHIFSSKYLTYMAEGARCDNASPLVKFGLFTDALRMFEAIASGENVPRELGKSPLPRLPETVVRQVIFQMVSHRLPFCTPLARGSPLYLTDRDRKPPLEAAKAAVTEHRVDFDEGLFQALDALSCPFISAPFKQIVIIDTIVPRLAVSIKKRCIIPPSLIIDEGIGEWYDFIDQPDFLAARCERSRQRQMLHAYCLLAGNIPPERLYFVLKGAIGKLVHSVCDTMADFDRVTWREIESMSDSRWYKYWDYLDVYYGVLMDHRIGTHLTAGLHGELVDDLRLLRKRMYNFGRRFDDARDADMKASGLEPSYSAASPILPNLDPMPASDDEELPDLSLP